jgi:hypothetical protein
VRYRALAGLTFGATGSIDHAVVTSSNNTQTAAPGERVLNVPAWSFTVSGEYERALMGDIRGFIRADYDWIGDSHGSFQSGNSNFYNPSYGVLNASVGADGDDWEVSVYGKNLGNDRTLIQRPEINSVIEGYTVRPLTVGITGKYHFE